MKIDDPRLILQRYLKFYSTRSRTQKPLYGEVAFDSPIEIEYKQSDESNFTKLISFDGKKSEWALTVT
jgi:hypothetical protein